ncbi:MAG: FtsX-like permease family protein [Gemmatimonadota bacterium]
MTGNDLLSMVNADSGGRPAAPAGRRLRSTLVAAQLAVAVVLVVGASLLFNSFLRVTMVDPGFSPDGLTTFSMPLKRPGAPVDEQSWMAWDRLLSEVHTVAGGGEVAAASNLPFESPNWAPPILLPGEPQDFRREGVAGYVITPNFFEVARIPVRAGRAFAAADSAGAAPVAIVNEAFVRQHLRGTSPVGLTLRYRVDGDSLIGMTVVGVVGDVVQERAQEGARPAIYVPYSQTDWPMANVAIRGAPSLTTFAPDLRRAVAKFSPNVPLRSLRTMTSRISDVRTEPRFQMLLLATFASVALLLAAVGLYGSLAHAVRRRTREMGIRMALGAPRANIFRLVFRQGMMVTGTGLLAGVAAALGLARFVSSFLFGVGALAPASFALAIVVLTLAAALAIFVPARRATGVDVVQSLKSE